MARKKNPKPKSQTWSDTLRKGATWFVVADAVGAILRNGAGFVAPMVARQQGTLTLPEMLTIRENVAVATRVTTVITAVFLVYACRWLTRIDHHEAPQNLARGVRGLAIAHVLAQGGAAIVETFVAHTGWASWRLLFSAADALSLALWVAVLLWLSWMMAARSRSRASSVARILALAAVLLSVGNDVAFGAVSARVGPELASVVAMVFISGLVLTRVLTWAFVWQLRQRPVDIA